MELMSKSSPVGSLLSLPLTELRIEQRRVAALLRGTTRMPKSILTSRRCLTLRDDHKTRLPSIVESNNQPNSLALSSRQTNRSARRELQEINSSARIKDFPPDFSDPTQQSRMRYEDPLAIDVRDIERFSYDFLGQKSKLRLLYPTPATSDCSAAENERLRKQKHALGLRNSKTNNEGSFDDVQYKPVTLKYRHRQTGVTLDFDDLGNSDDWTSLDDSLTSDTTMYNTVSQRILGQTGQSSRNLRETNEAVTELLDHVRSIGRNADENSEGATRILNQLHPIKLDVNETSEADTEDQKINIRKKMSRTSREIENHATLLNSERYTDRPGGQAVSCTSSLSQVSVLQKQFGLAMPSYYLASSEQTRDASSFPFVIKINANDPNSLSKETDKCNSTTPGEGKWNREGYLPFALSPSRNCIDNNEDTPDNDSPVRSVPKKVRKNKKPLRSGILPPLLVNQRKAWIEERLTTRAFVFSYFNLLRKSIKDETVD